MQETRFSIVLRRAIHPENERPVQPIDVRRIDLRDREVIIAREHLNYIRMAAYDSSLADQKDGFETAQGCEDRA
ncbi:MAG: hypothetical protein H0T95_10105 [Chthoniobacterales bacterium]|nr:hypothetical protein [Chthoniobacterales bacterium]